MLLQCAVLFGVGCSLPAATPEEPETQFIKAALARTIVGKTLPMAEVQRYCEARVARMPSVKTVAEWEAEAARLRAAVLQQVVFRGEAARWRDAPAKVEWLDEIPGGPGYRIRRLRYEALPGLWIPALLYEPEKLAGKVPVILNVNGHVGAPGKAYVPKQIRCINQAKRGMLALNVEWLGMGQLGTTGFHHARMNQLDLCGTSGLAPFYLAMSRALDLLLGLEHADPARVAVTGLSGGGWQTIVLSALDPRVTLANPVAGYSSFRTRAVHLTDLGDSEQTPTDLGAIADYCHLTAMRAPRPTLLTKNSKDDCCFASAHALPPLLEAAQPIFKLYGREDALRWHVNDDPGTHNYEIDNRQAFYRMVGDFFYPGSKEYDPKEIPCDKEVKTREQLEVPLPAGNEDFHTLAMAISRSLPRDAELPRDKAAAANWQQARRSRLREIVRAKEYQVQAVEFASQQEGPLKALLWKLQMGGAWTVPAVEFARADASKTAILVADGGRASAADHVQRLLRAGYRVVAVDPFYFGESQLADRAFLFALLVATVGDRPLGLQASQVAAAARWAADDRKAGPVSLVAVGPRSSTFALLAAALEHNAIAAVELHSPLGSLKELIEENAAVEQKPELFCFGLLEWFDIKQLAALVAPRLVAIQGASERAKHELSGLAEWYRLLGGAFEPVQ
ncbi:MAG: acetylxylan esterase [Thermoguttaceae bacterium]